ncbi:hypothetical protein HZH66_003844 [Vespula vulgaris]|uniref:Uncharacterized protein n=1 Tax=Vespula vulgaris TaxID=7454 RepID=A0A834KDU8_VESVU|nr:hypothetical protein HZH66_003844 [Vespula vulgaris]
MHQPARIEGSGGVQSNIVNPDRIRGSERSIALSFTVLVLAATPFASAQYLHKIGNRIMHSVICSSLSCRSGNSQKLACERMHSPYELKEIHCEPSSEAESSTLTFPSRLLDSLLKRLRLKAKNLESPNYDPPERNAILRERRRKRSEESRETSRWSRSAVRRNDLEV